MQRPPTMTPVRADEVARAFAEAARAAGLRLSAELVGVLVAHSALETGNWRAMYNYNFGNVKATEAWLAAGGDYTYYDVTQPGADAPVTENLPRLLAEAAMRIAKPRADGSGQLDMEMRGVRADGDIYCLFWPNHPQARFRAFSSLRSGAQAFLDKFTGKYAPALVPAGRGDVAGYVEELERIGPYFTANAMGYERLLVDRYRRYLPTARAAVVGSMDMAKRPDPLLPYAALPEFGALVSRPEDLLVPGDDELTELPSGALITKRAIQDGAKASLGRPRHVDVVPWLERHGLRLPSPDEYKESIEDPAAIFIAPLTMPTIAMLEAAGVPRTEAATNAYRNPRMRSARWCRYHDDTVIAKLRAAGWDGAQAAVNECKYWTTPRQPKRLPRIVGWPTKKGDWDSNIQDLSDFHGDDPEMTDYATGFKAVKVVRRQPWLHGLKENGLDPATMSLAERCLAWTGFQFGLGIKEIAGAAHNPAILAYSAHARRGGELIGVDAGGMPLWANGIRLPLGADEEPWCAAAASAALLNALLPDEDPPHGIRVSVREICEDAHKSGTLRVLGDFTGDPEPGWLAIEGRLGENPLHGGRGHVRRATLIDAARYHGLGGNENNTWGAGWYPRTGELRPDGHRLVAWVAI